MARRSQHITLAAGGPASTVTLEDFDAVDVVNVDGVGIVYFTTDGVTAPTIAGDETDVLPAAIGQAVRAQVRGNGPTVVKLISSAAVKVAVVGVKSS